MVTPTGPYSILVVEDNPDIVIGLQDLLQHDGYEVTVASLCSEALLLIRRQRFNVVLLDLGLPDGDGTDVLKELQRLDASVPVIILTAHIAPERTVGALVKGAFTYITKPYNREELRQNLRRAIGVKELAVKAERAEHLLTESEDRFRSLVESATDAIILSDGRGTIVSWNRAASRPFGYEPDEVLGRSLTILMPLRYRQAHEQGMARMEATGRSRVIGSVVELHGLRKDGTEFPIELSLATWKTSTGSYYSGFIRDTSGRKRTEQALEQLRHLHTLILTHAGEGIYGLDISGRTTFVNDSAASMLGYHAEELLGRNMHDTFHHTRPDGSPYPVEDCPIYAALQDGLVHRVEDDIFWRKDRTALPVEYVSTPIKEGTEVVGAVIVFHDTTERRQAQQAVEEVQRRFRQLAEHINEVFWITDPAKSRIIYVSPGYEQIWMQSCDSLYARPTAWLEAVHPEDRDRVREATFTKQTSGTYDEQYRIVRPDGSVRWIWDRAYPIRDESGAVYRVVGLAEDFTAEKEIEAALAESERKYRVLFDDNPSMYFMVNAEGIVLSVNQFGAARLGYRVEELHGQPVFTVFYGPDQEAVRRNLEECLSNPGCAMAWELRKVRKDGAIIWARETAQAVRDERGSPVVLIVCEDITSMKQAEQEVRASEERLDLVIRGSSDGFWDGRILADHDWRSPRTPVWYSPRFKEMLGYNDEEFPDVLESWSSRLHPDDRDRVYGALTAHIDRRVPYDVEYRLLTNKGDYHWFRARGQAIWDAEGRVTRMAGSLQSTMDRRQADETIRRSEQLLRLVADHTTAVIYVKDAAGRYLLINRRFEQIFGLTADRILGRTDHDLFPREVADAFRANDLDVLTRNDTIEYEESAPHTDGLRTYLSIKLPLHDTAGAPYAICGVSTDITERKRMEQALRTQESQLRLALKAIDVGTWNWDLVTGRVFWSPRAHRYFGAWEKARPLTVDDWLSVAHRDDRERLTAALRAVKEQQGDDVLLEHRVARAGGRSTRVVWTGQIIRDRDGKPIHVLGAIGGVDDQNDRDKGEPEDTPQREAKELR